MTQTKIAIAGGNDNYLLEALHEGQTIDFQTIWAEKYSVQVLMEQTSEQEIHDLSKELPTDTHYVVGISPAGDVINEAVRAYNKVDIFDAYCDAGYKITSITNGYGSVKPKLWVSSQ